MLGFQGEQFHFILMTDYLGFRRKMTTWVAWTAENDFQDHNYCKWNTMVQSISISSSSPPHNAYSMRSFLFFLQNNNNNKCIWKGINIFQMSGLCFLINSGNYLAKNVGSAVQTHSEIQWWYEEDRAQKHGPNKAAKVPTRKTWMALMAQSCWGRKDTT